MRKTSYLQGAFILTITNLITGALAFIYRIVLSKAIGAEGVGVYQLILPLYYLFITLVSGGLVTSISKLIAENRARYNFSNIYKIIKVSLIISGFWSTIFCLILMINGKFLGTNVLKDSRTIYSILVISPAIIFIALSSILKGYFYGTERVSIPAIIDIGEKLIRLLFIIFFTRFFINYGIEYVCAGAMLSMVCGEIISLILLSLAYKNKKKVPVCPNKTDTSLSIIKNILITFIPLSISASINNIMDMIDAVLIPSQLRKAGLSKTNSLSTFGILTGMILPLVYFPTIIIGSLSTTLIPSIAYSYKTKNYIALNKKCNDSITIASVVGFAASIIFIAYPQELCTAFFNCPEAERLLFWASLPCLFEYYLFILLSIMNGVSLQRKVLESSAINIFIMTLSIIFLMPIPELNIYAYIIGFLLSTSFVVFKCISTIIKKTTIKFQIFNTVVKPFLCSLLMLITVKSMNNYLIIYTPTQYNMILSYCIGLLVYFTMLFITKTFTPKQILNVIKIKGLNKSIS